MRGEWRHRSLFFTFLAVFVAFRYLIPRMLTVSRSVIDSQRKSSEIDREMRRALGEIHEETSMTRHGGHCRWNRQVATLRKESKRGRADMNDDQTIEGRREEGRRKPDNMIPNPVWSNAPELFEPRGGSNFADTIPPAQIPSRATIQKSMETSR
jgi:hypothetical protein